MPSKIELFKDSANRTDMANDVFADRRKPRALTGRQKGSEEAEGEGK